MEPGSLLARVQKLIWVFIYGGLLAIVLAYFVRPADSGLATWMQYVGAAFVVLGAFMIYLRSRLKDSP